MKYGKAALLMGVALLVPSQLCWADDASLNSAATHETQAIQSANVASSTPNSLTEPGAGSSVQAAASAADLEPTTPSIGGSESGAAGLQPVQLAHPTYTKGWNETEDGWVYLTSDAQDSFCEGWLKLGDTWYWFDPTTHLMATGVVECNGCMYRFVDSGAHEGAMTVGWSYDSEASLWYYARPSGMLECGWLGIGDAWYYFDEETCAMQTGWLHYGSAWYWLDEATGRMASSGWYDCDGTRSWFNASGVWVDVSGSVLGVSRQRLLEQLISHENDSYYLGTRYDTSLSPVCCTYPNGEPRSDGFTGMNCGGFVSHAYAKAGGDMSKIANNQSNSPWPGGPGRGSFCNAYRWYGYAIDSGATVLQFNSVSELLASGQARKGDLVFFYPFNPYSTDCHIGFFWGDTPYENRFWHSFGGMGNSISEFVSDGPSWVILMR